MVTGCADCVVRMYDVKKLKLIRYLCLIRILSV